MRPPPRPAPPRALASPWHSVHVNLTETFLQDFLAWAPFPFMTPDLRPSSVPSPRVASGGAPHPQIFQLTPRFSQSSGGGQKQ